MAKIPELIYCANGNARFAQIAIEAGFSYGAQLPGTVHFRPEFADQNWKQPNREAYMNSLAQHRPRMASVLDWERDEQLPEVVAWAEDAAQWVEVVMIIPKVMGGISRLPRAIGGKPVRLGFSVPTKHGGTSLPAWEFAGWPVHLLGGSPQAQMNLTPYFRVVSTDGNMAHKMATQFCAFWDGAKTTSRGYWPSLKDFDGRFWGDGGDRADAPYEAFARSCRAIMEAWKARESQ